MRRDSVISLVAASTFGACCLLFACEDDSNPASPPTPDGGFTFDGGSSGTSSSSSSSGSPDAATDPDASDGSVTTFFTTFQVAMTSTGTCAVFPDGRMKCWGLLLTDGLSKKIGENAGEMGAALPYVQTTKRVKKIRSGSSGPHCVIWEDGGLRCWGNSAQLGQPTPNGLTLDKITTDINLGAGRTAVDLAIGGDGHVCVILDNGSVKCWGSNSEGQLGIGTSATTNAPDLVADLGTGRTAKQLAAGYAFTCALLDNDRIKCWGRGNNTVSDTGQGGELGNGSTAHVGNNPNEMGDNLQYARIGNNPANGQPWKVKKVTAGRTHTCAMLENDRVKCWGRNDGGGQVGSGNSDPWGLTIVDDALPFVDLGTDGGGQPWTVKDVTAAEYATCVVLSNNNVRCWGTDAGYGLLGRGTVNATIGDGAGEMGNALVDVMLKPGRTPTTIYSSALSFCVRVSDSTLNCWGSNGQGHLGQGVPGSGATSSIGDTPTELGANLSETLLE